MEDFAMYILSEKDYIQKMIIAYYMAEKTGIFFDKSIVLRAEIARMFMNYTSANVDKNKVITAMLLCNCKKIDNSQKLGKMETYAKEGADYLSSLGFDKEFCDICEGLNRYSGIKKRKKESDILELVDQFTGLILKRAERDAFSPEEALIILKERNLKNVVNRYLEDFIIFVKAMERVNIKDVVSVPVIKKLVFLAEREKDAKTFIAKLGNKYSKEIDSLIKIEMKRDAEHLLYNNIQDTENVIKLKATRTTNSFEDVQESNTEVEKTRDQNANFLGRDITNKTENSYSTITNNGLANIKTSINKTTKKAQSTKNKIQIVHRYTRKIIKQNPNRALFSKEAVNRIMSHDTSYRFD